MGFGKNGFNLAVWGSVDATGTVGESVLSILAERDIPVAELYALASQRSAGSIVEFKGRQLSVGNSADFDFARADIGLFSAGAKVSAHYAPEAARANCVVIDNTSQLRYDDEFPLVVLEVNSGDIAQYTQRGIIANPNCYSIQMVMALKPIYDETGNERVNVAKLLIRDHFKSDIHCGNP